MKGYGNAPSHHHLPARSVGRRAARGAPIASAAVKPQITRVTPMRISVGNLLTIRGKHFRARAKRNTVIFRANNGRTAFAGRAAPVAPSWSCASRRLSRAC